MAICRNSFGKLSYTLTNKNKAVFSVTKDWDGRYRIKGHRPYVSGDAYIFIMPAGAGPLWIDPPVFVSFVQAVKFLKENQDVLHY